MKKHLVLIVLISIFLSLISFVSAQTRNQAITNIDYKGNNVVEISGEGRLNYTTSRYPDNRLVVNIRGAQLTQNGGRPGEIAVNNGVIQKITYSQFSFNPMITRIVYHLTDEHELRETFTGKSTLFSVGKESPPPVILANTVSNIKYNGNNQVEIESGGKLNYTTYRYPNNRLVMDIQGSKLTSNGGRTGNIAVNNGTINTISYSQFSRNPMTTRIVYHLTDEHGFTEYFTGDSTVLTIGSKNNTQPPAKPTPTPPTPSPDPKPANPSGRTIVIDPGHGGKDPGAVENGLQEKAINLQIAKKLESELKNLGYNVIMTRSNDEYLTLSQRAAVSNNANGEIFISIHSNSFTTSSANGIETFHYVGSSKGTDLAKYIQAEVIKATEARDRGVKAGTFQVLRDTRAPAALIEVGFISNPDEAKKISSESYQQKITNGLIIGIQQYLQKY